MLGYPRWGLHPFLLGEKSTIVTILLLVGSPSGGVALDLIMLPYLLVVDLSLYLQLWIPLDGGSMIVVVLVLVAGGEPGSSYSAIWLPLKIIFLIGCVCCWEIISAFSHLKVFTLLLVLHWVQNSSDFFPLLRTPLSSGFYNLNQQVHSNSYLSSFVYNMLFSLDTFKLFLFITNFHQLDHNVLLYSFPC